MPNKIPLWEWLTLRDRANNMPECKEKTILLNKIAFGTEYDSMKIYTEVDLTLYIKGY